jgi:CBS domain-containing protein
LLDRDEIARLAAQSPGEGKISDANSKGPLPFLFRDQSLEEALHAMGDWPALPVVNRADLGRLEGVITLAAPSCRKTRKTRQF